MEENCICIPDTQQSHEIRRKHTLTHTHTKIQYLLNLSG